jgi:hypothetical protein
VIGGVDSQKYQRKSIVSKIVSNLVAQPIDSGNLFDADDVNSKEMGN